MNAVATSPRRTFLTALLLALAPAAAGPSAQESAPPEATARARRHLVHLEGGAVLRGPARQEGEAWSVRLGETWTRVPAVRVTRVVLERDVLREASARAKAVGRDEHDARVRHARWLAGEGLHTEALDALRRVFEADPDHAEALAFVGERPFRVALPDPAQDLDGFLTYAARTDAAARAFAVSDLVRVEDRAALRSALDRALVDRAERTRSFAALALRRLFPGEGVKDLVRRAVLDRSRDVRTEAALALRDAANAEARDPVIAVLASRHSLLRRHAAEALGHMSYPAAVKPMIAALRAASSGSGGVPGSNIFVGTQTAYVQDFDVEVAQGEAIANPSVNVFTEGAVLDARVLSTHDSGLAGERRALYDALTRLTGTKVRRSAGAWERWWEEHGAKGEAAD